MCVHARKVLDAYSKARSKSNADAAAEEAAQRLWRYRQPLAFGVHHVAPDGRLLACDEVSMPLYRQNDGLSEEGLMRHVSSSCLSRNRHGMLRAGRECLLFASHLIFLNIFVGGFGHYPSALKGKGHRRQIDKGFFVRRDRGDGNMRIFAELWNCHNPKLGDGYHHHLCATVYTRVFLKSVFLLLSLCR